MHGQAGRCNALHQGFESNAQAKIFQNAGRELEGDGARAANGFLQQAQRLARGREHAAGPVEAELGGVEQLAQAVVQDFGNAPALGFLGRDNGGQHLLLLAQAQLGGLFGQPLALRHVALQRFLLGPGLSWFRLF